VTCGVLDVSMNILLPNCRMGRVCVNGLVTGNWPFAVEGEITGTQQCSARVNRGALDVSVRTVLVVRRPRSIGRGGSV
jgi:hypothetical protein